MMTTDAERITTALEIARRYGATDGDHHKAWVIDQMVRALTGSLKVETAGMDAAGRHSWFIRLAEGDGYRKFVADAKFGEAGPETYEWSEGIAP
jgi:hypothetical protein